jgi:excinuclease UvrABC nuclease subunit
MKARRTRALTPYNKEGKANFPARNKSGVYLIYKGETLTYIGHSKSDLYKTMYRHFQSWNDRTQIRVSYKQDSQYKVRVIYCSPTNAVKLEKALIVKYKPKDNPEKYDLFTLKERDKAMIKEVIALPVEAPF